MEVFNPSINELKETNIPIVEITTDDESNIDSKDIWKEANLKINGEFCGESDFYTEELQIKGRGNSSWGQPKKSYSLKLSDKIVPVSPLINLYPVISGKATSEALTELKDNS